MDSPLDPIPSAVPLRAARAELPELLDLVQHGGERIAITRKGETAAVLISREDFARLTGRQEAIRGPERSAIVEN